MDSTGKPFGASEQKIAEKRISTLHKKTVERKDSENENLHVPCEQ